MKRTVLSYLLIVGSMSAATWVVGWWGLAVVALVAGVVYRAQGGRSAHIALAAVEAWGLLLVIDAVAGPLGRVSTVVAGAMSLPPIALLAATLLFAALLAWSAATVSAEVAQAIQKLATQKKVHPDLTD